MRSTRAIIDTDALASNLAVVRKRVGRRKILAMVKANAYGHGMVGVSRVLQHVGVDVLGVAFVEEAATLRSNGITIPIVVLTPFERDEIDTIISLDIDVTISDATFIRPLGDAAVSSGKTVRCHVFVDTGMHRDGVPPEQAVEVAQQVSSEPGLLLQGLCTHLASADDPLEEYNDEQLQCFAHVVEAVRKVGLSVDDVHVANTGALWNLPSSMYTMIRPGLSLYGYEPTHGTSPDLHPVLSLRTRVVSLRTIQAGQSVSYGRRWRAKASTQIATLPIGYGDGYPRALTGKAQVLVRGARVPVVGTICMDECMIDVGMQQISVGEEVVVIGRQDDDNQSARIDAVEIAGLLGTIPYEVTTALSARVPRVFVGQYAHVASYKQQGEYHV